MAFITEPELQRLREVKDYAQKHLLTVEQQKSIFAGTHPFLGEVPEFNATINSLKICFAIHIEEKVTDHYPWPYCRWLSLVKPRKKYHLSDKFIIELLQIFGFIRKLKDPNLWIEEQGRHVEIVEPFYDLTDAC